MSPYCDTFNYTTKSLTFYSIIDHYFLHKTHSMNFKNSYFKGNFSFLINIFQNLSKYSLILPIQRANKTLFNILSIALILDGYSKHLAHA